MASPTYKISVIVPCYNVEKELPRCIDSILKQTYTNLEILPIDDGSTDTCGAILDQYAQTDNRVRVIHQPNGGLVAARRTGVIEATGDYLFFVDADDWIEPETIQCMLERALQTQADVTVCLRQAVFDDGHIEPGPANFLSHPWVFNQEQYIQHVLQAKVTAAVCTKLFKKGVLEPEMMEFPRKYSAAEDHVINCGSFRNIKRAAGIDKVLYNYYMRSTSISHTFIQSLQYYQELFHIARANMGSDIDKIYYTWHQQRFLQIYLDIIFANLMQHHKTDVYSEPFQQVLQLVKDKGVCQLLPKHYQWRARLIQYPHLLHLAAHLRLLMHRKPNWWTPFQPVDQKTMYIS